MNIEEQKRIEKRVAKEIDIKSILTVIKLRIWILIISTIFFTFCGFAYNHLHKTTYQYQSSTRVLINASTDQMSTIMVMFTDPTVLGKLSDSLNGNRSPSILDSEITVTPINGSQIVNVTVTDPDPYMAAQIANNEVSLFKDEVATVLNFRNINDIASATVNRTPINLSSINKTFYGSIAGIVLGIFLIFLVHALDESIHSEKELELLLELQVLGSISKITNKNTTKGNWWSELFLKFKKFKETNREKDEIIQDQTQVHSEEIKVKRSSL